MRIHLFGTLLVLVVAMSGCGSDDRKVETQQVIGESKSTMQLETQEPDPTSSGLMPEAAIATCAGFSADAAASILGLAADAFEDRSEVYSSKSSLCSFLMPDTGDGIGFYLVAAGSVERAIAEMEQGRGIAGIAQDNIDRASATTSVEPPLQGVSGIGEEAYFMEANGSLMVRVGNVQIQVLHMDEREQMKKVGQLVAQGLQAF